MDKFEKFLEELRQLIDDSPLERTPECPSDDELIQLALEKEHGPLREQHMPHVLTCKYCASILRDAPHLARVKDKLSAINRRVFPMPEEIDWGSITVVKLFKDHVPLSIPENELAVVSIDIQQPGFYHLEIQTGQVLWTREIVTTEICLSDEEWTEVMGMGMAASQDEQLGRKLGFQETKWDGRLTVELVKRRESGRLIFKLSR